MSARREDNRLPALDRRRNEEVLPPDGHGDIERIVISIPEPCDRCAIAVWQCALQYGLDAYNSIAAATNRIIRPCRHLLPRQRPCQWQSIEDHCECCSPRTWLERGWLTEVFPIAIEPVFAAHRHMHRRCPSHLVSKDCDITCK